MVYGLQPALMGILSVWVSSFMINKTLMIGGQEAKNVMIISNKHKEIMEYIHKELNRGTTLLQAVGGYSQEKRPVIMAVIVKKQLHDLQMIVSHIDPEAFVIVTDTNEVQGWGLHIKKSYRRVKLENYNSCFEKIFINKIMKDLFFYYILSERC